MSRDQQGIFRKVALDRRKRVEVWRAIEEYRRQRRQAGEITWAELASIVQLKASCVGSVSPAVSVARTWKVWEPSARPL